jgi:hypothetical protein
MSHKTLRFTTSPVRGATKGWGYRHVQRKNADHVDKVVRNQVGHIGMQIWGTGNSRDNYYLINRMN